MAWRCAIKPVCVKITVTTAGTPVQLSTDRSISINSLYIVPNPNNGVGPYYLGNSSLVVSTLTGVIQIMNGLSDTFSLPQSQIGNNQLSLSDYWVDVTTSGDSFLVTYWVA